MSSPKIKPQIIPLSEFLSAVPGEYRDFVSKIDEAMAGNGYKQKIEKKASGLTATYSCPNAKKIVFQFYFRKNVLHLYLYLLFFKEYDGFLDDMPSYLIPEVDKTFNDCKRMIDPKECNQGCIMGYVFTINDTEYKKCLFGRISAVVDQESMKILSVVQTQ
jgi:hypothetical protein